jgi:Rrf2 family iron-sulfur cluster assembly transcriptional regulator
MRITPIEEYGLRCLLVVAGTGPDGQLSISEIAEMEGLSVPYASKLLSILRKADLVKAVRGRSGGFRIARSPEKINLLEVITGLGGPLIDERHCDRYSGQQETCVRHGHCVVRHVLGGLACHMADYLESTTVADILNGNILREVRTAQTDIQVGSKPARRAQTATPTGPDNEQSRIAKG